MKVLKKIFVALLLLIALLIAIAYLLPRDAHVERAATINAPAKVVFSEVNDLRCWNKWATWNQIDPEMKVEYINGGIGDGAGYEWNSQNPQVGQGKLLITGSIAYDSIAVCLDFMKGDTATGYFLFKEDSGKTVVTWAFNSHLGDNPLARWMGLMFGKMIGTGFEKGLDNLNTVCLEIVEEQRPVVEIVNLPEIVYAGLKKTDDWQEIGTEMGSLYVKIMADIQKQGLTITGMPFAVYHSMEGSTVNFECGIPVNQLPEKKGNVEYGAIAAGKYAFAVHVGSYETLEKEHSAIQEWITKHEFELTGGPMEIYMTDPQNEPDTTKWVTNIYYPL
jgi:effector-binding domain-containing protein